MPESEGLRWIKMEIHQGKIFQVITPKAADLDYQNCMALRKATLCALSRVDHERIILDLAEIGYLDASALGYLLDYVKEASDKQARVAMVTNETIMNILGLTRLQDRFIRASTKNEAVSILIAPGPAA